jgi:hypothetical protein
MHARQTTHEAGPAHATARLRLVASVGLLLLLAPTLGCGGGGGDPPPPPQPDFTKAGEFGTLPQGLTSERAGEVSVETTIPSPLVCGTDYDVTVRVRQQVAVCETFDYRPLYDRAVAIAQARVDSLPCQPMCPVKQSWLMAQTWDCLPIGDPPVLTAVVLVRLGVRCVAEGTPPPNGLAPPDPGPLVGPLPPETPPLSSFESITEEVGGFIDPPCGTSDVVTVEYFEKVATCAVPTYLPYVQRANARAQFLYDRLTCQAGCVKDPFVVQRIEWECAPGPENFVHVTTYFVIRCRAP